MALRHFSRNRAPSGNSASTRATRVGPSPNTGNATRRPTSRPLPKPVWSGRLRAVFIRFFPLLVAAAWLIANKGFAAQPEPPAAVDLEAYVSALIRQPDTAGAFTLATLRTRFPVEWEQATSPTVPTAQKGLTVYARGYGHVRIDGAVSMVREGPQSWPAVWQFFLWKLEGLPAMASVVADFKCTARLDLDACTFDAEKLLSGSGFTHELVCHEETGNLRVWLYRVTSDGDRPVFVAHTQSFFEGKGHLNAIHVIRSSLETELDALVACTRPSPEAALATSRGTEP